VFLAIVHNNSGVGVIFRSSQAGNFAQFPAATTLPFFLVGMFMSLYVIYGFDTASTLAEETRNPRAEAPKAVLASVIGAFVIGAIAAVPFIQFAGAAVIAVGATASIYLSYLLGNLAFLRARTKGWPKTEAPFKLGAWGMVVNVVAVLWGIAMMLNFLTPSS